MRNSQAHRRREACACCSSTKHIPVARTVARHAHVSGAVTVLSRDMRCITLQLLPSFPPPTPTQPLRPSTTAARSFPAPLLPRVHLASLSIRGRHSPPNDRASVMVASLLNHLATSAPAASLTVLPRRTVSAPALTDSSALNVVDAHNIPTRFNVEHNHILKSLPRMAHRVDGAVPASTSPAASTSRSKVPRLHQGLRGAAAARSGRKQRTARVGKAT